MTDPWYKNAVVYAVDVEKYADSNGDGIGDLAGLTSRIDHIAGLGVTCLWLLPFYPSPRRDNGYDVIDHYSVDPRFGTLDDFIHLVHSAGERGIRVLIDIVADHTSVDHPWFCAARRDKHSRFRDYYIWTDSPPALPIGRQTAFPGEPGGETVWTYDPIARSYYYHRFYDFQPQLDMSNREVRRELERIIDFWLALGVAGFRIDALPIMFGHDPAVPRRRYPALWLRELRAYVQQRSETAALLGEVDLAPGQLSEYFGDGDGLHMLLDFYLDAHLFLALASERKDAVLTALRQLPAPPHPGQWVNFLRNLDELNLGWLTAEERELIYSRFGPDPDMRIYDRGLRRRLAPMLGGDRKRLELTWSLLFSLPGTPMLTYGDEIGIGENLEQPGRDAARVPMQWSSERNGGFSSVRSENLVRPVVSGGRFGYQTLNVRAQAQDEKSFLNWFKTLVAARRSCPEIGSGSWSVLDTGSPSVLAHQCVWKDGTVVMVHNLSREMQPIALDLRDHRRVTVQPIFGPPDICEPEPGVCAVEVEPYGYRWLRVLPTPDTREGSW